MNAAIEEANGILSIGTIIGGETTENVLWYRPIREIRNRLIADQHGLSSDLCLNVVYHIPGDVLLPEFVGVRTGSYRSVDNLLMVQVALPESPPDSVDQYLARTLLDALDAAESWAVKRKKPHDLQPQRDLIARL